MLEMARSPHSSEPGAELALPEPALDGWALGSRGQYLGPSGEARPVSEGSQRT